MMKKRLSRQERRDVLLEAAVDLIRLEGCDAMTLGKLARHADLSKPLVYDHFGTREGLLIELCTMFDARQRAEIKAIADDQTLRLGDLLSGIARCYIASETARDWQMLNTAMASNMITASAYHEMAEQHVALLISAITVRTGMPEDHLRILCAGLIGAADAVTAVVLRGGTTVVDAATALTQIFQGAFPGHLENRPGETTACAIPALPG